MFDLRHLPLPQLGCWQTGHLTSWHPELPVGFVFWSCHPTVFLPRSASLNFSPGIVSSSTLRSLLASSPFGVDGTMMGAMCPPLVPQLFLFLLFSFLLSAFLKPRGLFRGTDPSASSFSLLSYTASAFLRTFSRYFSCHDILQPSSSSLSMIFSKYTKYLFLFSFLTAQWAKEVNRWSH